MKLAPTKRRGGRKSFSHAEGRHKTFLSRFYTVARSFSHIERGGGCTLS